MNSIYNQYELKMTDASIFCEDNIFIKTMPIVTVFFMKMTDCDC